MPSTPGGGMGCGSCAYRLPDTRPGYDRAGYCRRNPPQVVAVADPNGGMIIEQHYPWMAADDWCAEHTYTNR